MYVHADAPSVPVSVSECVYGHPIYDLIIHGGSPLIFRNLLLTTPTAFTQVT